MKIIVAVCGFVCLLHIVQGLSKESSRRGSGLNMLRLGRNFNMLRLGKRSDLQDLLWSIANDQGERFEERQAPLPRYGRELILTDPNPRLGRFRRSVESKSASDADSMTAADGKFQLVRAIPMPRIGREDFADFDDDLPIETRAMHMLRLGKRRMAMLRLGKRTKDDKRAMAMLRLGRSVPEKKSS